MDWELSEKIEKSILNSKFDSDSIKNKLKENLSHQVSEDIVYMLRKITEE